MLPGKSSATSPALSQSSSASGSITPSNVSNPLIASALIASSVSGATAMVQAPDNNFLPVDSITADLNQQLSFDNGYQKSSSNGNIPNCARVNETYTAITEDEISVQKGDMVQIITANMHNRFLVHREANEHQPAAEGWIPGFVIGFQSTS